MLGTSIAYTFSYFYFDSIETTLLVYIISTIMAARGTFVIQYIILSFFVYVMTVNL